MIINMLRFAFRAGIDPKERDRALVAIVQTARLKPVAFSCVGQDLGDPADGFSHAYLVAIPDLAALHRYLSDPLHRQGDFIFLPTLQKLSRAAMSDDGNPDLGARVGELVQQNLGSDAEWRALFAKIPELRL